MRSALAKRTIMILQLTRCGTYHARTKKWQKRNNNDNTRMYVDTRVSTQNPSFWLCDVQVRYLIVIFNLDVLFLKKYENKTNKNSSKKNKQSKAKHVTYNLWPMQETAQKKPTSYPKKKPTSGEKKGKRRRCGRTSWPTTRASTQSHSYVGKY